MKYQISLFITILILLQSCIKDDFVNDTIDPEIRITSLIDTLALNSEFQFEETYFNNIGSIEEVDVIWTTSNSDVVSITEDGLATALTIGEAVISVVTSINGIAVFDEINVVVGETTTIVTENKIGEIMTTSSYKLAGAFILSETSTGLNLSFDDSYEASTALPGLYIYLSNNKNSIANALEISSVEVFNGAHSYEIENVRINDFNYIVYFCKPFNVKVGDGQL